MSKSRDIPWVIELQTKIKHQLLNDYLGAWMAIMYSQQSKMGIEKKLIFVDGFSGPGEYWNDETRSTKVNGSPIIVAEKANKFIDENNARRFLIIAIDSDKRCVDYLQPLLQGLNKHKQSWTVLHTTFEQGMDDLFGRLEKNNADIAPSFFFIDPFGYSGFTLDTMVRILNHRFTEVFINFMHYDINRFLEAGHSQGHLQALFGTDEYKKASSMNSNEKTEFFMNLYCQQLKKRVSGVYILPFRMNTPGQGTRPRYFLLHVSKHVKALKEMKNQMGRASDREFCFEAIGLGAEQQFDLFEKSDEDKLKEQILKFIEQNNGKIILYENVEDWAYEHTSGISRNIKKSLKELEDEKKLNIIRKAGQRVSTVTDGAKIQLINSTEGG